ncbi:Uncharacterized protein DAT39_020944, partial [Clarias magur]
SVSKQKSGRTKQRIRQNQQNQNHCYRTNSKELILLSKRRESSVGGTWTCLR